MDRRLTAIVLISIVATMMVGCPPTTQVGPQPVPGPPIVIGPGGGDASISWSVDGTPQSAGDPVLQPGGGKYGLLRRDFIGSSVMHVLCDRDDGNPPVSVNWVTLDNGLTGPGRIALKIERTNLDDVRWTASKGSSTVVLFPSTAQGTGKVPLEFTQLLAASIEDHTGKSCKSAHLQVWMPGP